MPQYNTNTNPRTNIQTGEAGPAYVPPLDTGSLLTLWDDEAATTGEASQQFCMHRNPHLPNLIGVDILFEADPGNCEIALQTADVDLGSHYVTKTSIKQDSLVDTGSGFAGRIEASVVAKFARLKMVSKANASVKVTAIVS